jgi:hypothetical protein
MSKKPVNNYLVPASGTTNAYSVTRNFNANAFTIDFREYELDGVPFVPSGVFINNTSGSSPLRITIGAMDGYAVECPAGAILQTQYPAPFDQIVTVTGNGVASLIFVDFPVLPFLNQVVGGGSAVTIADGADVALGSTTDAPAPSDTANDTVIAFLKRIAGQLTAGLANWTTALVNLGDIYSTLQNIETASVDSAAVAVGFDSDGDPLPVEFNSLARVNGYTGSDLTTITVTDGVNTWVKTFTYTGPDLTGESAWVK